MTAPSRSPWPTLLVLAAALAWSLPACDPVLNGDDDDSSSASDDDDSTPLADCPADEDAQEENDDVASATQALIDDSLDGVACPEDPDFFHVAVPNCRVYALSVSGPGAGDLGIWLHGADGAALNSVPSATEGGGVGYEVSGTSWSPDFDDDDDATPPPAVERYLQVFAPEGTDGGLTYTLDVVNVETKMCDE